MNISYAWLKDYIDVGVNPPELTDKLTFAGIEVEKIDEIGGVLRQVLVAEIIEKSVHPNAEKLSVCKIDTGEKIIQVVCGAPNCTLGLKVAFAPIGTSFGEFKIKKAKLRGVSSMGMICSEQELGISDNHDGIMELPTATPLGIKMADYCQTSDTVYEVEITPNRPDLLGMIGVAKDLSALLDKEIKLPQIPNFVLDSACPMRIQNEAPTLCPRYTLKQIKNVTIAPSPDWLQARLKAVGLRPINNVVDITNYVMLEYGHPLHAFDLAKLAGETIIIRSARAGESFDALDEKTYILDTNDLVIADKEKALAIAGVIGGADSNIDNQTVDIVIEAANFAYSCVRKSSRRLKIFTDSAYRFERGMSSEKALLVSHRAAQLILEIAGGTLVGNTADSYPVPEIAVTVSVRPSRVKKLLTIDIEDAKLINYLTRLGLQLSAQAPDLISFIIPLDRPDLSREIDLIEEIIRLHGYNNVASGTHASVVMDKHAFYLKRKIKNYLVRNGFYEAQNVSYANPEDLNLLNLGDDDPCRDTINIMNPLSSSFSIFRSSLIPGLLHNTAYNINHGEKNIKLFELNKVFTRGEKKLACETYQLTAIMCGNRYVTWDSPASALDFFDMKGISDGLIELLKLVKFSYKKMNSTYSQAGQAAQIIINKKPVGEITKLDAKILAKFDIEESVYLLDINIDDLCSMTRRQELVFKAIPKLPPVSRDISFVIGSDYTHQEIANTIYQVNTKLIKDVVLFDEYTAKGMAAGTRSLSYNIILLSETKTLTDEYVSQLLDKVISTLNKKYQIKMR